MKKTNKLYGTVIAVMLVMLVLAGCANKTSRWEFSFSTKEPSDSYKEKMLYINQDADVLEIDADLKIDSGQVKIVVLDQQTGKAVYTSTHSQDETFMIRLENVRAGQVYSLQVTATGTKDMKLILTSDAKMVQDKEKPER